MYDEGWLQPPAGGRGGWRTPAGPPSAPPPRLDGRWVVCWRRGWDCPLFVSKRLLRGSRSKPTSPDGGNQWLRPLLLLLSPVLVLNQDYMSEGIIPALPSHAGHLCVRLEVLEFVGLTHVFAEWMRAGRAYSWLPVSAAVHTERPWKPHKPRAQRWESRGDVQVRVDQCQPGPERIRSVTRDWADYLLLLWSFYAGVSRGVRGEQAVWRCRWWPARW